MPFTSLFKPVAKELKKKMKFFKNESSIQKVRKCKTIVGKGYKCCDHIIQYKNGKKTQDKKNCTVKPFKNLKD
jgi:hypothetical protein